MCHINNGNDCYVIIKEFIKTLLWWNIKNKKQCGSGTYREYGFCADVRNLYVCEERQIKISFDTSLFIIFLSLNSFFPNMDTKIKLRLLFKAQKITFPRCFWLLKIHLFLIGYHSKGMFNLSNQLSNFFWYWRMQDVVEQISQDLWANFTTFLKFRSKVRNKCNIS